MNLKFSSFLVDKKNMKNEKGFTVLELLVSVAIIGLLVAIAIPEFNDYKDAALRAQQESLLHNLRIAYEAREDEGNEELALGESRRAAKLFRRNDWVLYGVSKLDNLVAGFPDNFDEKYFIQVEERGCPQPHDPNNPCHTIRISIANCLNGYTTRFTASVYTSDLSGTVHSFDSPWAASQCS